LTKASRIRSPLGSLRSDVQDAQNLRKVGLVRHLFIRQVEAA